MILNFKKTCEKLGIHEFSRTRGGWMKMVEGIDKSKEGGYSFIGDQFIKVGNFNSNLQKGIYLDQSTSMMDDDKTLTMNLFSVEENGNVVLLKSIPKRNGWAYELWDTVDEYFHKSEEVTAQDIVNTINEMTTSEDIIAEVIAKLSQKESESMYDFRNWFEVRTIFAEMNCEPLPIEICNDFAEKHLKDQYVFKCDAIRYNKRKFITTFCNLICDANINEETFVDCKNITTTTFKSNHFKNEIKNHRYSFYYAHTVGNNTGYHNGIKLVIGYFEDNTIVIRHLRYFFNTDKTNQKPYEFDEDLLLH